jgi:cyclopropane-fatty-acyl-phospholipid synthase
MRKERAVTYQLRASDQPARPEATLSAPTRFLLRRTLAHFSNSPLAMELILPDGGVERVGAGPPSLRVSARTARGVRALGSLDEGRIADAYLAGDVDFDGDMLRLFELKDTLKDWHPLLTAWRFLEPLLLGQVRTDKRVIAAHYDRDAEFFLQFLDPKQPMYTQGIYERDDEPLEAATLRKFDYCYEQCRLKPGDRLLEVGPGWGAWLKYAARRGVECTGISISQKSIDYLKGEAKKLGVHWELIYADLLEYKTATKFDAVVIMGVIEHMPFYDRVLEKCMSVLKPGGRIFLDGVAFTKKYALASYIAKHIYPGNHSYLVLHDFLEKVARTPLQVREIFDDRYSYFLTFQQWARNFDRNRETVVRQFGELDFRRFRLYLWGSAYQFFSRGLGCFRMIIEYPVPEPGR